MPSDIYKDLDNQKQSIFGSTLFYMEGGNGSVCQTGAKKIEKLKKKLFGKKKVFTTTNICDSYSKVYFVK